jgi:SWI/SNF-related matrix-associated actin-dependent regulator of chromatin subfamily B protein 1
MGMARPPQFNPNQMPNMQGVNPAEFPFDYRIIPALRHAADPRWQSDMSQKNPGLLHAVNNAQHLISQGLVRPEVLQKMHQFYFATQSMGQVRPPPSASGPGPSGIPPQIQQQFNTGQSQGQGGPSSGHGTPSRRDSTASIVRPPPPHTIPESPAADESRPTTSRENKVSTPTETAMPPPAWIPGQAQPTPVRPPSDARPQAGPSSAGPGPGSLPVKEWEGALRLDLPITKITTLPEESDDPTFDGKLPEMSEEEIKSVLEWMETDKAYASGMSDRKKTIQKKMVNWARNSDIDTPWWSVRKGERYMPPRARLQIMFPRDKDAQRVRRTHKGRRYTR